MTVHNVTVTSVLAESGVWADVGGTVDTILDDASDATYRWTNDSGYGDAECDLEMNSGAFSPGDPNERLHRHRLHVRYGRTSGEGALYVKGVVDGVNANLLINGDTGDYSTEWKLQSASAETPRKDLTELYGRYNSFYPGYPGYGNRILETSMDLDYRDPPTFTADMVDHLGVPTILYDASNIVRLKVSGVATDSLPVRGYRWAIYTETQIADPGFEAFVTVPVLSGSGSGSTPNEIVCGALPNDEYRTYVQVSSTLGYNVEFWSAVVAEPFEVDYTPPDSSVVDVTVTSEGAVTVEWEPPAVPVGNPWDDEDAVVVEIVRTDCLGVRRTYVGYGVEGTWTDYAPNVTIRDECGGDITCETYYTVTLHGYSLGLLVSAEPTVSSTVEVDAPGGDGFLVTSDGTRIAVCADESWDRVRPSGVTQPIGGGYPTVLVGDPGGRDYRLQVAVATITELHTLEAVLAESIVWFQPGADYGEWLVPVRTSGRTVKTGRVRRVDARFVAVEPLPIPDPMELIA